MQQQVSETKTQNTHTAHFRSNQDWSRKQSKTLQKRFGRLRVNTRPTTTAKCVHKWSSLRISHKSSRIFVNDDEQRIKKNDCGFQTG